MYLLKYVLLKSKRKGIGLNSFNIQNEEHKLLTWNKTVPKIALHKQEQESVSPNKMLETHKENVKKYYVFKIKADAYHLLNLVILNVFMFFPEISEQKCKLVNALFYCDLTERKQRHLSSF